MQQDNHVFQGLRRDNHQIRQDAKFLWDAHNIRFTARDDNTLLSMTNERGTEPIDTVDIKGLYVGHCIIGEYIIVFTEYKRAVKTNYIYRISKVNDTWKSVQIYEGDLKMNCKSPLQTLGIYEGDLVQKVYWVDGINQPRVINVVADKLMYDKDISELTSTEKAKLYPQGCFDFVQELSLNEEVTVTREEGGGAFPPGTIQYAFSYYNKYGQETNLFYTTELFSTSFITRGGSPEDVVNNTFHISIKNPETRFQYLRIYSIHRTSIDATPTVKIVTDVEITNDSTEIVYIDTGLTGSNIDPTKMLYIGGESIIAGTIAEKDNTLFLGNIELKRQSISDEIKDNLKFKEKNNKISIAASSRDITLKNIDDSNSIYTHNNQLSVGNTSTFKIGDIYRLGVQFQHKSGKWSEPCFIKDYVIPRTKKPKIENDVLTLPSIKVTIDSETIRLLEGLDYKKARPLVVLPTVYDRMVIAQGILCPTVFSVKDRVSNTPFAQSSWFFRPMSEVIDNTKDIGKGATVSFAHLEPLKAESDRGAEIQNMTSTTFAKANYAAKKDRDTNNNTFFIDQSIVTMHSPDIEFDDSTKQALENGEFELNIVGLTNFKSNAGDISIQTSSSVPSPNDVGFFHKTFLTTDYENKGMVAGMFYKSHLIDDSKNAESFGGYNETGKDWELNWLIYPWHRSGSLNNDIVRPSDKGTRTSVLKRKVISNIRFSPDNIWLNTVWSSKKEDNTTGITPISIFSSNEISLIKIPIPKNSGIKVLNYYGNVDTLITTDGEYTFYVSPNTGVDLNGSGVVANSFTKYPLQNIKANYTFSGDYHKQLQTTTDPVRMKYKSTDHAVFAFDYLDNASPVILPSINFSNSGTNTFINKYTNINTVPFWSNKKDDTPEVVGRAEIEYRPAITGGADYIEETILKYLKEKYSGYAVGTYAICTCSSRPSEPNFADLYQRTVDDISPWVKVSLNNLNAVYESISTATYWRVQNNGQANVLAKFEAGLVYSVKQDTIKAPDDKLYACLFLAELRRKAEPANIFGGKSDEALRNNLWIPAGKPVSLNKPIDFIYGDTYYQRYDCLKTYSFTTEDENSVVEIASFMCESRVNLDGRYDRNRGQISNLNMSPQNFNLINSIYSQRDNFFNYRILDKKYYRNVKYPTQILWSMEKSYLDDIDIWSNITLANSLDLSGSAGAVTSIEVFNDLLIAFQEKSVNQILFNSRVQIPTSDGVPVEISNSYKVDGARPISTNIGCQSKWSIAKSPIGLYFIDNTTDTLYLYNSQLQDISTQLGVKYWLRENHPTDDSFIRLSYDTKNKDLYLSPKNNESLCYSEQLGQFTSLMSYVDVIMFPMDNDFLSFKCDEALNKVSLWENFKGPYNSFYNEIKLPSFTYICNENPTYTKVFDTIEYRADIYDDKGNPIHNRSFDWIKATNEYQDSGIKSFNQSRRIVNDTSLRKKFRIWRGQIPRQHRERIRNPWTAISLGFNLSSKLEDNHFQFVLHDISTKYTV